MTVRYDRNGTPLEIGDTVRSWPLHNITGIISEFTDYNALVIHTSYYSIYTRDLINSHIGTLSLERYEPEDRL